MSNKNAIRNVIDKIEQGKTLNVMEKSIKNDYVQIIPKKLEMKEPLNEDETALYHLIKDEIDNFFNVKDSSNKTSSEGSTNGSSEGSSITGSSVEEVIDLEAAEKEFLSTFKQEKKKSKAQRYENTRTKRTYWIHNHLLELLEEVCDYGDKQDFINDGLEHMIFQRIKEKTNLSDEKIKDIIANRAIKPSKK